MIFNSKTSFLDFFMLTLLLFATMVTLSPALNKIALYVVIPFLCLITFLRKTKILLTSKTLILHFLLVLWMGLTSLNAVYADAARDGMVRLLSTFLLSVVIYSLARKSSSNIKWLYIIYMGNFISLMYYGYTVIGFEKVYLSGERLNDETLNANSLAYFLFYSSFGLFMLTSWIKSKIYEKIALILVLILTVVVSILTASRQVVLIQIPLLIGYVTLRYINFNAKNLFKMFVVIPVMVMVLLPVLLSIFKGSTLEKRMGADIEEDSRFELLVAATEVGLENPVFGVGTSNFIFYNKRHEFSHSTYFELFAGNGVIALILFLAILIGSLKRQYNRYRFTRDNQFLFFLLFLLVFCLYNFFYVFINSLWLMPFYYIVECHSDAYFRAKYYCSDKINC